MRNAKYLLAIILAMLCCSAYGQHRDSRDKALDRYEGFPSFYYKKDIRLQYKGIRSGRRRTVTAFAYVMHEDRPIGIPSNFYMRVCLEGYDTFFFDRNILLAAYDKCAEVCGNEE